MVQTWVGPKKRRQKRALESFSQLIHTIDNYGIVNTTFIGDFPRFKFRGQLIDTSRHYLPISVIKVRLFIFSRFIFAQFVY